VTFNLTNAPVDFADDFATDTFFFRINAPTGFGDIPIALRNESGWPNQADITITEAEAGWDGTWKTFQIPLSSMATGGVFDPAAITNVVLLTGEGYTADLIAYLDYIKIGNAALYPIPPALNLADVTLSIYKNGELGTDCNKVSSTVAWAADYIADVDYLDGSVIEWNSYEQWQGVTFDLTNAPVNLKDVFDTDTLYFRINVPTGFGDIPIALRNESGWPNQVDITITEAEAGWDGTWHTFKIPLNTMVAGGVFDSTAITNLVFLAGEGFTADLVAYFSEVQIGNSVQNAISETENLPKVYSLNQNYPNPFNPTTSIRYSLPKESNVKIIIYDIVGKEIRTLVNQNQSAGYQSIIWDGKDNNGHTVSTGIYLCRMVTDEFRKVQKMTFLK
ncbi:MAG: FlgD immunoglobulin-like domain containing protein, partial [Candidatus Neomarinimicrobiota bacterium]